MDPFTERILERARERQKKLLEFNGGEAATPLREFNNKAASTPAISSSLQDSAELQKTDRKCVTSDSDLCVKSAKNKVSLKGTVSAGNVSELVTQNSKTFVSSDMPGSPQLQLKTLNIQKENFNMEIKLSSTENVRIEVELQEESDSDEQEKENIQDHPEQNLGGNSDDGQPAIREGAKKRLQQLGKLYAGGEDADISSPIHRTEATFLAEGDSSKEIKAKSYDDKSTSKGRKGLGGLSALAKNINQWEDDLSVSKRDDHEAKSSVHKRPWKPPAPRPPISNSRPTENLPPKSSTPHTIKPQAPKPPTDVHIKAEAAAETEAVTPVKISTDSIRETPKQLKLDPALVETLESQGFTRTTSNTRLIYKYDSQNCNNIKTAEITTPTKIGQKMKDCIVEEPEAEESEIPDSKPERSVSHTSISKITENKSSRESPRSPTKSNIKGSAIANRAAMFESVSSPNRNSNNKDPALLSVSERKALFEKNKGVVPLPKAPISMAAPLNTEKVVPKNQNNGLKVTTSSGSSPTKEGKSSSTTSVNISSKSPTKGENSTNSNTPSVARSLPKYPAPRPPIRTNDKVHSSAYRVAPGESGGIASKMAALFQNKTTISQQQIENSIREQRQKEMDVLLNRFHKNKQAAQNEEALYNESESDNEEITETTAMITEKPAQIVKKSAGIPLPPPPPPGPSGNKRRSGEKRCSQGDSPNVVAVLDDVKRIKVSPNKPGRLYPCLSDIEAATETEGEQNTASPSPNNSSFEDNYCESDADAAETSFGREILQTVCKNQTPQKRLLYDESTESDMSDVLDDMDDYIDEALAYDAAESGPTPPKQGRSKSPVNNVATQPSSSFQYKNFSPCKGSPQKHTSPAKDFKIPSKVVSPRSSDELPAYVVDGDNVLPLTHTVSFYRKQQTQGSKTPIRQVIRHTVIEESSESTVSSSSSLVNDSSEVQKKIQELLEEMTRQQTIISQTSQALNLCYSTPEFTGSTEQVEAEKVLLLATHRRAAAQREMERLSISRALHPENKHAENIPLEKGSLSISNIVLPLKRDYVRALNATGGKGHHVVCLIKCAEQVLSTQLVSTVATNDRNPNLELAIPGTIKLNNIYSNFTVQFEVYCLQAQEEMLPHEVKYHINKKTSNKLTPKKGKPESRLVRPPKESPGGPQAVRSPTFALMGYVVFSIQGIGRKNWTLNNTPSMSPLEGIVEMRVKCELALSVEHRGFLTMFEDVSGFGAWHRRWCLLKGHILSYWKYPDEEKKKAPIDSIDLSNCITQQVGPVRRDICARLHTILIETTRPAQPHDKDSLVMECKGDKTIIRHLLSVDTKEERVEWCMMFNKALTATKVCRNSK